MDPATLSSLYQPRSMKSGIKNILRPNDSASLWNCTLSPGISCLLLGWSPDEVQILRKALIKFGIGSWSKILNSNCLPNKTNAQMNLQTQKMLGQQSTAGIFSHLEFAGLHIDPFEIGKINSLKTGPEIVRKNGCIINTGSTNFNSGKLSRAEVKEKLMTNKILYELPKSEWNIIDLPIPQDREPQSFPNEAGELNSGSKNDIEVKKEELKRLETELQNIEKKIIQLKNFKNLETDPKPELLISTDPASSVSAPLTLCDQDLELGDFSDVEIIDDDTEDSDFVPSKRYRTTNNRSHQKHK